MQGPVKSHGFGPYGCKLHELLPGGHAVIFIGAVHAQHIAFGILSVNALCHGHGMLNYFCIRKTRIGPVDQETFAFADAGQHPGNKIRVVPIVVIGIGKNINQDIRGLQRHAGDLPVGISPPGTGVEIRGVQQYQAVQIGTVDHVQRLAGDRQIPGVLQRFGHRLKGGGQIGKQPAVFGPCSRNRKKHPPVQAGRTAGGRQGLSHQGVEQGGFA